MASFKRRNDLTLIRVYALWVEVWRNSALTAVMAALYGYGSSFTASSFWGGRR